MDESGFVSLIATLLLVVALMLWVSRSLKAKGLLSTALSQEIWTPADLAGQSSQP